MSATRDRKPAVFDTPAGKGHAGISSDGLSEPLLTADEAARLLHVPRSTVYELVRSRGLPHVKIGPRGLRFTRTDLARWVGENTFASRLQSRPRAR